MLPIIIGLVRIQIVVLNSH